MATHHPSSSSSVRRSRTIDAAIGIEKSKVKRQKKSSSSKHSRIVHPDEVARVRNELEARRAKTLLEGTADSDDDDPDFPPIVLKENITFHQFIHWSDYEDDKSIGRIQLEYDSNEGKGKLVVYTLPHPVHGRTASEVVDMIKDSVENLTNRETARSIQDDRDVDCQVSGQGYKPECALIPRNLAVGGNVLPRIPGDTIAFANVIIEVEYTHLSLPRLKTKLQNWIGPTTSTQVAIGIKIMPKRRISGRRRMVGLLYKKGVAVHQEVEFGNDISPAALVVAQLTFNATSLFHGVPFPSGLVGQVITIPLAPLQGLVTTLIPS